MAIWGVYLKPNEPYILTLDVDGLRKSLRITQASLVHNHGPTCTVRCVVGMKEPIYICKLSPTQYWKCKLDLRFDGSEDVVLISDRDVHLGGHFISPGCVDGIVTMDCNRTSNINESEDGALVVKDSEDEAVIGKEHKRVGKQLDNNIGLDEENRSSHIAAGTNCIRSHKNLKKRKKTIKITENQNSDMGDGMHPEKVDTGTKKTHRHEKDKKRKKSIATEVAGGCHKRELHLAKESNDHGSKGPVGVTSKNRSLLSFTETDKVDENMKICVTVTNTTDESRVENRSVGRKVGNLNKAKSRYIVKQRKNDNSSGKTTYGAFGY